MLWSDFGDVMSSADSIVKRFAAKLFTEYRNDEVNMVLKQRF